MAPKRIHGEKARRAPKGYLAYTYGVLTSPDNAAFVRSIALFGAAPVTDDAIKNVRNAESLLHCAPIRQGIGQTEFRTNCLAIVDNNQVNKSLRTMEAHKDVCQTMANLAHSPKHGTATIPRQKRPSGTGRGLSHLVSKFEILDSLSRQSKPVPTKKTNLPGCHDSTLELNRPPSSTSSVSARSLYNHVESDSVANVVAGLDEEAKDNGSATGEARVSLVAERRKLFEVNLGDGRLTAPIEPHHASGRPVKQVPFLSKWQTLRARSPSPCMAQSQKAVLSRPTIPNASKSLAGYLPLASTCPSLPRVQIGAQPHTLSDCAQSCTQDGRLDEDWTSIVTPGPSMPSPTTDKDNQAPTSHRPLDPGEDGLAPNKDQETPRAGVMSSETSASRRFREDDFTTNKRHSTSTVDEIVHHGAAAAQKPYSIRSTEFGIINMHTNACGIQIEESQPSRTTARPPKENQIEAVAGHFEASPKKPLNPQRISNTIEHFEALISGDGSNRKHKSSIRLPKRLTGSTSCRLSRPENTIKMGATESTRRKFSNSWGPARFRKSRAPCGSDARQSKPSDEPSHKVFNDPLPTDGTMETSPPSLEHWLGRFHNDKKMNTGRVAQLQSSKTRTMTSGRLRPKGPRPQPATTAENRLYSQSAEQVTTGADMRAVVSDGRGSWRSKRRWVSRSSIPLVAQADCALQQPKPIRVNEVRRLVSLCRDKMTARKHRAQTD
ncbi:hypothetical protein E4U41_006313 [Claviceps citrina]|nr:hypothetical protein E4U41_006313 [Claviceps citrina]